MKYLLERKHFHFITDQFQASLGSRLDPTVIRSPNYISNGHWMLHKSKVMNFDMFLDKDIMREYLGSNIRDFDDSVMENIQRGCSDKRWVKTCWEYHNKGNRDDEGVYYGYSAYAFLLSPL